MRVGGNYEGEVWGRLDSYARSTLYTFSIYGSPSEAGVIVKLAVFRDLSGDNTSSTYTWLSTTLFNNLA